MSKNPDESSPTIVGGQPIGRRGGDTGLPHGIESIVLLAAADPRFREDFSKDRMSALRRAGIKLTEAEEAILATVGDNELFAVAKAATVRQRPGRRSLLVTAASLAALASLTTSSPAGASDDEYPPAHTPALSQLDVREAGDEPGPVKGAVADVAPPTDTPAVRGIQPTPTPLPAGILPDEPTMTSTEAAVEGIRPDDPTDTPAVTWTETQIAGIQPDTPTVMPTEIAGIQPDTPTPEIPTLTPTPEGIRPDTPTPLSADLNADGTVNRDDLLLMLQQWYKQRGETSFAPQSAPAETGKEGSGDEELPKR